MKPNLADQLQKIKLDFSSYSKLPIREDVILMGEKNRNLIKQWEKLNMLRKHLQTIDRYIQHNKGELLKEWLKVNNTNLASHVLDQIGKHNNDTGGISAYFYNLQTFYDTQEKIYDDMEAGVPAPPDLVEFIKAMRATRKLKSEERRDLRKIKVRNMKKDGKGFLAIPVDEPVLMAASDGEKESTVNADVKPVVDALNKGKSNIKIWIGGGLILIAALAIYANTESK